MIDSTKTRLPALSRRSLLSGLGRTAGGAALLAALAGIRSAYAQAKTSQKAVGYQTTPHGTQQCDNCRQFIAPNQCKVVEGDVVATGWCKVYIKKPAGPA